MKKKLLIGLIALLLLGAATLGGMANFWTEYEWFSHLGFGSVYVQVLGSQIGTGIAFGLVALVALLIHIYLIKRFSKPRQDWVFTTVDGEIDLKDFVKKVSTPVVVAAAVVAAGVMGYLASRNWEDVLKFLHQSQFGQTDPIFHKDYGFYLFELPTLEFVQEWFIHLTGICAALSAAVYFLRGAIVVEDRWPSMSAQVRAHLLFSVACVVAVIGLGYRVEMFETLYSKRGVAYGATYTDVFANLIAYRILIAACFGIAIYLVACIPLFGKNTDPKLLKWPGISLASLVGLYLLGVFAWPTIVQQLVVNPNEYEKEKEYLVHAISGTRYAYALDKIEEREFPANQSLTAESLTKHPDTIDNIKVWDHRPLKETYKQLQVIRLYYDFPNISVDRYRVDGRYYQVMLSAREMVHEQLPEQSQTWVNRHLQYTHGYGVCLSPVNSFIGEGLPDFWVKDIPPKSRYPEMHVEQPRIYYGLETWNYALVKTTEREFDFPEGKSNQYTTYDGKGGVSIGNFFRRTLFSMRFGDRNLFFTTHLTPESRILFNRNIQERILTVAPFLMLDQEPYMTIVDGRMLWIQDAYTISYRFPYSQPTTLARKSRINYIRNSVKVVVDAYDGTVDFYVWDESDPMIQTYRKMFPALFKSAQEMPAKLRPHVRYPQDLFSIQSIMYESFHMTDPQVFYNQEDKWTVSRELKEKTISRASGRLYQPGVTAQKVTDETSRMAPYYMIMRLPGEAREEFLLMAPFTPTNKDNMVAWMTARCDDPNYGKLMVYNFPKQKLVFGPMQVEARINQDEFISQWITLRNQQGSTVIRGDLLVIPIEDSLLYVEPVYLQADQTQLPELKQVIVAFDQRLSMKDSLEEALAEVFDVDLSKIPTRAVRTGQINELLAQSQPNKTKDSTPNATGSKPGSAQDSELITGSEGLAAQALQLYKEGKTRLAAGDWVGYGETQEKLAKTLEKLAEALKGKIPTP